MRPCGLWDCGPETSSLPGCRECWITSKAIMAPASLGKKGFISGGVYDQGPHAEDGPATWEALASPRRNPGLAESR
jgi:hypothetical protein